MVHCLFALRYAPIHLCIATEEGIVANRVDQDWKAHLILDCTIWLRHFRGLFVYLQSLAILCVITLYTIFQRTNQITDSWLKLMTLSLSGRMSCEIMGHDKPGQNDLPPGLVQKKKSYNQYIVTYVGLGGRGC